MFVLNKYLNNKTWEIIILILALTTAMLLF